MDEKISLNGVWQWSAADSDAVHPGIVPGSVLSDMLALNLCEDPYWRRNEYKVKQLFYKDYAYWRSFKSDSRPVCIRQDCAGVLKGLTHWPLSG